MRNVIDTLHRGYIDSWNLIFERRLPWDMSLSAGYVGTKTTQPDGLLQLQRLLRWRRTAGQAALRAFGRTGGTYRFDGWLDANYHSLQVALNKPFARGLFVKAAYTWSKAMNRTDDEGWSTRQLERPRGPVQELQLGGLRPHPHLPARLGVGDALRS